MSRSVKTIAGVLGSLAAAYGIATAGLYAAMRQPPERFGAVMAKMPMVSMLLLPFEPLWMSARQGRLAAGDRAPDFSLPLLDHSRQVRLSGEYRDRPVVLIFGSYT